MEIYLLALFWDLIVSAFLLFFMNYPPTFKYLIIIWLISFSDKNIIQINLHLAFRIKFLVLLNLLSIGVLVEKNFKQKAFFLMFLFLKSI